MSTLIFLIMDYNPKSMANLSKNALSVPNLDNESIGKRLARLRKVRGYSQAQLARKVGIEPKLISDYETGKLRLYDMVLGRIAIALDVTTDTILGFNKLKSIDLKPSLRIWKRLKKIQQLPSSKQKRMLATIDDILKANGLFP